MRITAILLLAAGLTASAGGRSQGITLKMKNASLDKVFLEIKKQTGYSFVYTERVIRTAKKVDVDVRNSTLDAVLKICFEDQSIGYTIIEKTVVIKPREIINPKTEPVIEQIPLNIDVRGRLVNENGEPVAGASVKVKGLNVGTTTDENGGFSLSGVDPGAVLVFSGTNIETFETKLSGRTSLDLTAKIKNSPLDEVQIQAYGTTSRRLNPGNIGTIKGAEIAKQPVTNPILALAGRIPGIVITQESGVPGGPVTIRIQGQNSISKGNEPLIVIDGIPYYSTMPRTGNEGAMFPGSSPSNPSPLAFINPSDIESIDVLKDADATSIYGSRAANGAILITTKKGTSGNTKVDINVQQGWGNVTSKINMLNARQYLDMRYEAYRNDNIDWRNSTVTANDLKVWDTTRYTNWQKTLIGNNAQYTRLNASLSGGTTSLQYLIGVSFNKSTTVFPGDFSANSETVFLNLNNSSSAQKFKFQLSNTYSFNQSDLPGGDLTASAVKLEPVAPALFNDDGSLNWAPNSSGASTWENPMTAIKYYNVDNKSHNILSSLTLGYKISKNFELKSSFGYNRLQTNDHTATQIGAIAPENRNVIPSPRSATFGRRQMQSLISEPQLVFNSFLFNGKIQVVAGATLNKQTTDYNNIIAKGFSTDASLNNMQAASTVSASSVGYILYKYAAAFGRINYNWKNRYLFNLAIRRDGTSRFGEMNKYHNFASIAGAWVFTESKYFQNNLELLSFGKIRASFGTTGSDQIGDYAYLSLFSNVSATNPYQGIPGMLPNTLPNPYLQWEETRKLQLGLDLAFIKDRVIIGVTYARNRSSNQLLGYALPTITGAPTITDNFPATVQNTSFEFVINTANLKRDGFEWTSSFNLTIPKNKLIEFPNLEKSTFSNSLVIGQPLGIKKVFQFAGVDAGTGLYFFRDINGNLTSKPAAGDRETKRSKLKYYGGFENRITYKRFSAEIFCHFVNQTGVPLFFNNANVTPGSFSTGNSNQPITVLDRWRKPGDVATIERFTTLNSATLATARGSDANFLDASYLRVKNISVSWQLPESWIKRLKFRYLKLSSNCQNLFTITQYIGLDPESQNASALPPLRVITFSLQAGL